MVDWNSPNIFFHLVSAVVTVLSHVLQGELIRVIDCYNRQTIAKKVLTFYNSQMALCSTFNLCFKCCLCPVLVPFLFCLFVKKFFLMEINSKPRQSSPKITFTVNKVCIYQKPTKHTSLTLLHPYSFQNYYLYTITYSHLLYIRAQPSSQKHLYYLPENLFRLRQSTLPSEPRSQSFIP